MKKDFLKWQIIGLLALIVFSCSEKNDPAPPAEEDNLVSATVTGSRSADELKFFIQLSGRDIDPEIFEYDVDVYNVVYKTTYKGYLKNRTDLGNFFIYEPQVNLRIKLKSGINEEEYYLR